MRWGDDGTLSQTIVVGNIETVADPLFREAEKLGLDTRPSVGPETGEERSMLFQFFPDDTATDSQKSDKIGPSQKLQDSGTQPDTDTKGKKANQALKDGSKRNAKQGDVGSKQEAVDTKKQSDYMASSFCLSEEFFRSGIEFCRHE